MAKQRDSVPADTASDFERSMGPLVKKVGSVEPGARQTLRAGCNESELVGRGREVRTDRILRALPPLYMVAVTFWLQATPAQRRRLRGVSLTLFALAVHELIHLHKMQKRQQANAAQDSAIRGESDFAVQSTVETGKGLREQATRALRSAAGHDERLRGQLELATGTIETAESLAAALDALAGVLQGWLKKGAADLKMRLGFASLDATYAEELAAQATAVRSADEGARLRPAEAMVSQAQLDCEDGFNLHLAQQIVQSFQTAHALDRTIPELKLPAMRRLLGGAKRKRRAPAANGHDASRAPHAPVSAVQ